MHIGGCATWNVQEPAPEQVIAEQEPDVIQITKTDGTKLTVWDPRVVGDSLMGLAPPEDQVWAAGRAVPENVQLSVALEDVQYVAVEGTDWGVVIGVGLIAAAALVAMVVVAAETIDVPSFGAER
jgi:hypothetical protein